MNALRMNQSSRSASSRACVNCQKRKSRCIRSTVADDGACTYCARAGKSCSFESPPDRTPLTRRNLDASEARCAQLVSLLRSLHPELDIEASLAQIRRPHGSGRAPSSAPEGNLPGLPELAEEDGQAHEYEWHEQSLLSDSESPNDSVGIGDGMATLATLDAGYLGSSSGSSLLEEITSLIRQFPHSPDNGWGTQKPPHAVTASTPSSSLDPPSLVLSAVTAQLIDAYFLFYNRSYPILHEATFRQKAANTKAGPAKTPWRVVYYMVLAIGHWTCTADLDHTQSGYYAAARSSLSIHMLEAGTIETLQAFLLMGNYLQKRDRPNTGYNLIGIAYKMALGLGLHQESSKAVETVGRERQRRLFWTVYCFDSGFNITTGRPPSITEYCIDTKIPSNIDDRDPNTALTLPEVANYPTTTSCIAAQSRLAKIANYFYNEFLLAKSASKKIEYQVAEAIDRDLSAWRNSLPNYFTADTVPAWFLGPRAVVSWKQQNLRILLWRGSNQFHPFLQSKPDAERLCLDVAMQSTFDIAAFCNTNESALHQGINWYATYFLFQATLVLEESFLKIPSSLAYPDDIEARQLCVTKARACLEMLAQKNRSAHRCLEIIDRLHKHLHQQTSEERIISLQQGARSGGLAATTHAHAPLPNEHEQAPLIPDQHLSDFPFQDFTSLNSIYDDFSDPTLRMLIDQTSLDCLDDAPVDVLFEGWGGQPYGSEGLG